MPTAATVDITTNVDRRVPVATHALLADAFVLVGPDFLAVAGFDLQQGAARTVCFGDENAIAHDDGIAGVHAFENRRAPRIVKFDLARRRLQSHQTATREHEAPAAAVNRRQHRAGVAGCLVGDVITDLAGVFIESHDAAVVTLGPISCRPRAIIVRTAADLGDEQIAFDNWRGTDAEKILPDIEVGEGIDPPNQLAIFDADTVQHPLDAVDVDAVAVHDR